eukprot:395544_1
MPRYSSEHYRRVALKFNWRQLSPHPKKGFHPFPINDDEFLLLREFHPNSIQKYSTKNDAWNEIFVSYPNMEMMNGCGIFYSKETQLVYYAGGGYGHMLYEINIVNDTVKMLSNNILNEDFPQVFAISNKIHIIGGDNSKQFIFDKNTNKIINITYNYHWAEIGLHMESRNSIMMVVKEKANSPFSIYEFLLENNKWMSLNIKLPNASKDGLSMVKSRNEKYIFIIDGLETLNVYVLNIQCGKLKKSCLEYPCFHVGDFGVINMTNKMKDELLVFGYVKKCYQLLEFNEVQYLPHYLVQCIVGWISIERIHFILMHGAHWMINIDDILCSLI